VPANTRSGDGIHSGGLTISEAPDATVRMMSRHGAELLGGTRESFHHKTRCGLHSDLLSL
jgi:hypothetical protein